MSGAEDEGGLFIEQAATEGCEDVSPGLVALDLLQTRIPSQPRFQILTPRLWRGEHVVASTLMGPMAALICASVDFNVGSSLVPLQSALYLFISTASLFNNLSSTLRQTKIGYSSISSLFFSMLCRSTVLGDLLRTDSWISETCGSQLLSFVAQSTLASGVGNVV